MSLKTYSILMGDIISSRKAESEVDLYTDFNNIISKINKDYTATIVSPLTITLGDEFQALTEKLDDSFLLANIMRIEFLKKGIDMRFVIGTTIVDSKILNKKNSWNMMGHGLAEARELLDDKKNKNSYRFSIKKDNDIELITIIGALLNSLGLSLTKIENKWTANQLATIEIVKKSNASQIEVAKKLKKSRYTLLKALKSAQSDIYDDHIASINRALKFLDTLK